MAFDTGYLKRNYLWADSYDSDSHLACWMLHSGDYIFQLSNVYKIRDFLLCNYYT